MSWKRLIGAWLACCFVLAACSDSKDEPTTQAESRTVLVYIAGDNSLSHFASDDVQEMVAGLDELKSIQGHLLVYMDTGSTPTLLELECKKQGVVQTTVKEYKANRNSVGLTEMKEVLADAFSSRFKADRYGLVFWSHGDGWYPYPYPSANSRWIGQDKSNGEDNRMNLADFAQALQSGPHLDFLLLDVCYAASLEVAYEIKDQVDYVLGSPTETPGPGAPYDALVKQMFHSQTSGSDYVLPMAQAYFNYYNTLYDESVTCTNSHWTGGVSITLMQCSALPALATATRQALAAQQTDLSSLSQSVLDYDKRRSYPSSYIGYFDLVQLMQRLSSESAFPAWKQAFDAAVPYFQTTPKNYSSVVGRFDMTGSYGLSHYLPQSESDKALGAYRTTSWYQEAGLSKLGW